MLKYVCANEETETCMLLVLLPDMYTCTGKSMHFPKVLKINESTIAGLSESACHVVGHWFPSDLS